MRDEDVSERIRTRAIMRHYSTKEAIERHPETSIAANVVLGGYLRNKSPHHTPKTEPFTAVAARSFASSQHL